MPPAVAAIAYIVTTVAAVAAAVAVAVVSFIATAAYGIIEATVSLGMAIGGAIADTAAKVVSVVFSVASTLLTATVDALAAAGQVIANVAKAVTGTITAMSKSLTTVIENIKAKIVTYYELSLGKLMKPMFEGADKILAPIKDTLTSIKGAVDAVKAPIEAIMEPLKAARELLNAVSSLKILGDLLKGQASVADALSAIAGDQVSSNAAAILTLYRDITNTTIDIVDKVDVETKLLWTSIDQFDERIKTSVNEGVELAKAGVMNIVTPRLDTIGTAQAKAAGEIAMLNRHLEDVPWFAWMLLRLLT